LSGDESTLVFTMNDKLHMVTRRSRDQKFGTPQLIAELQDWNHVQAPRRSSDGLHLVWFSSAYAGNPRKFWISNRDSKSSPWAIPREITLQDVPHRESISWPRLLEGGHTLLCTDESKEGRHRFVILRRESRNERFHPLKYIELERGTVLTGHAAQYVPATNEFYFLSDDPGDVQASTGGPPKKERFEIFRLTSAMKSLGPDLCRMISEGKSDPNDDLTDAGPQDIGRPSLKSGDSGVEHLLRKGLSGWQAADKRQLKNWNISGDVLTNIEPAAELLSKQKYRDFDLHLEFLLPNGANSGVYLRGRYEVQLTDDPPDSDLIRSCGSIWEQIPILQRAYQGPDQWNTLDVRLVGKRVTVVLNGVLVIESQVLRGVSRGTIDKSELDPGELVLQSGKGVKFRNILIKPLKMPPKP
jgi:hypothetical protein